MAKKKAEPTEPSDFELAFQTWWRQAAAFVGVPAPVMRTQYHFHRWLVDVADPEGLVAIELDGGTMGKAIECDHCGHRPVRAVMHRADGSREVGRELRIGGGHSTGDGARRDREKGNALVLAGWSLFRFTREMIEEDPIGALAPIVGIVHNRRALMIELADVEAAIVADLPLPDIRPKVDDLRPFGSASWPHEPPFVDTSVMRAIGERVAQTKGESILDMLEAAAVETDELAKFLAYPQCKECRAEFGVGGPDADRFWLTYPPDHARAPLKVGPVCGKCARLAATRWELGDYQRKGEPA